MSKQLPHGRRFYMIRHAETEDNKNKVVSGKASETVLTDEGRRQATEARQLLAKIEPPIDRIITSEMHRVLDTARLISDSDALRHVPHRKDSGINERNYGEAEGKSDKERDKIKKTDKKIEGEEPKDVLSARTIGAIAKELHNHNSVPLFVTHGGNIRRVLEHTLGENVAKREYVTNCTLYEFIAPKEKGEDWKVNVLELDDNKEIKRHNFGEKASKVNRLVGIRSERQVGIDRI